MLYEIIIFFGSIAARIISLFNNKMAMFFTLRKGEIERIAKFLSSHKNQKADITIWFHSASAGEFEQAKPLIENFRRKINNLRIVASFFSPSGYEAGIKYDKTNLCFNLPLDYRKNAIKLLQLIKPDIIIFSKYDVWRNLAVQAHKSGARLVLVSATLPEKSMRHKFPFRMFFRHAYSVFEKIYSISEQDAARFKKITGTDNNVIVSGDTRFDRVKTVIKAKHKISGKVLNKKSGFIYLVAGSTYEISEKKIIPVAKRIHSSGKKIKLVLVPHEIDEKNITRLKKFISSQDFTPVLYSGHKATNRPIRLNENEVLIIDAFGVLARLYAEADIVFIGGSYKGSVHSVLEPAIFGKPILTGPHIGNAYEALVLKEVGGLTICRDSNDLHREIIKLSDNQEYRKEISEKVKTFFNNNTGATDFVLKDIWKLITESGS